MILNEPIPKENELVKLQTRDVYGEFNEGIYGQERCYNTESPKIFTKPRSLIGLISYRVKK